MLSLTVLLALLAFSGLQAQDASAQANPTPTSGEKQIMEEFSTVDNPHLTQEEIRQMATRNVYEMMALTSTTVEYNGGNDISVKGLPAQIYVDGVKVRGTVGLPQKAIQEVRVVSGPTEFR